MSGRAGEAGANLAPGERVVHHLRTHPKALFGPGLAVFMLAAVGIAAGILLPAQAQPWGWIVVAVVAVLALLWFLGGPFLKWRSRTFTVTTRRIVTRSGVLNRTGHDIQLHKVNSVAYDRSLADRMFGCGTLKLDTASEAGVVVLPDVPGVEEVQRSVNELLFAVGDGSDRHAGRESE
ncbi:PH domain-containing protein [Mariniluteicoccus flavus]